jgi:hypothetical protein
LFVGGRMSYLRYCCLFAYSVVHHMLCCVFGLFFLRLVCPVLPVSLDCLWCSIMFIYIHTNLI